MYGPSEILRCLIIVYSTCRKYNGWSRDADSFRQWVYSRMSSVVTVLNDRSFEQVLHNREPWLVDFYAPWCGHCHVFAPDFEDIARVTRDQLYCLHSQYSLLSVYVCWIIYIDFFIFRITNHEINILVESFQ